MMAYLETERMTFSRTGFKPPNAGGMESTKTATGGVVLYNVAVIGYDFTRGARCNSF
jgi:hypothetical protein